MDLTRRQFLLDELNVDSEFTANHFSADVVFDRAVVFSSRLCHVALNWKSLGKPAISLKDNDLFLCVDIIMQKVRQLIAADPVWMNPIHYPSVIALNRLWDYALFGKYEDATPWCVHNLLSVRTFWNIRDGGGVSGDIRSYEKWNDAVRFLFELEGESAKPTVDAIQSGEDLAGTIDQWLISRTLFEPFVNKQRGLLARVFRSA